MWMEVFVKIINGWKPFTIFVKRFILDVWQSSEYFFDIDQTTNTPPTDVKVKYLEDYLIIRYFDFVVRTILKFYHHFSKRM